MKHLILCIAGLLLFTGCIHQEKISPEKGKIVYETIFKKHEVALIQDQKSSDPTMKLSLIRSGNHVEIRLHNPKEENIRSMRTWLAFQAGKLTIKNFNLNNGVFDLAAPNEYTVDKRNGIIRIGLSSTRGTNDKEILVGSFDADNNGSTDTPLSCYDYGNNTDSHCMVLNNKNKNMLLPVDPIMIPKK